MNFTVALKKIYINCSKLKKMPGKPGLKFLLFAVHLTLVNDLPILDLVDVRAVRINAIVLDRIYLISVAGTHSISLFHCYHRLFF